MKYLKLMRPSHYIKNFLIFLPIVFSAKLFEQWQNLVVLAGGFLAFSLICSCVYIVNDVIDAPKDRLHSRKKHRPIASGAVSVKAAFGLFGVLLMIACLVAFWLIFGWNSQPEILLWLGVYLILNVLYSLCLKNYPIIDVAILASGFLLRLLYGSALTGIAVSNWLYLTVIAMSFYLGLGKRRNEILAHGEKGSTRKVLKYYSQQFLDKNMYVCLGLTIVFYSLWTVDADTIRSIGANYLVWTVPLVILICMKYSLNIEGPSSGDPVEVLLRDKVLIALVAVYVCVMFCLLYLI